MKQFNKKSTIRPTQMSKANKILAKNKNVVVGSVQTKQYYAIGEKTVSSVVVSLTGSKTKTSEKKSFICTAISKFRGQAIDEFNDWANLNGLSITFVGLMQ